MSNHLSALSDRELLAALHALRGSERESLLEILRHLNEVERRKLHLKLGYSSMFVYCTEHLCYSESTAARRVQAARCVARFPKVETLLVSGEINLVTLGLVANLLTPQNVDWFLEKIRNKRQREVEAIAAAFRPATYLRDRVLRVSVPAPVTPLSSATTPSLSLSSASTGSATPAESATPATGESANAPANSAEVAAAVPPADDAKGVTPGPLLVNVGSNSHNGSEKTPSPIATVPKLYIQFLADENFMRDYNEACALLSNSLRRISFSTVFTAVLRDYLERHSPKRRQERRDARQAAIETPRSTQPAGAHAGARTDGAQSDRSRVEVAVTPPRRLPISPQTRDAVFLRDQGQCTYVGRDGHRCSETNNLHVDHIKPVARNGKDELENLRLLCSTHNRLEAERILGPDATRRIRERDPTAP